MTALDERLKAIVGPDGWTTDAAILEPHLTEWRGLVVGKTRILVAPRHHRQGIGNGRQLFVENVVAELLGAFDIPLGPGLSDFQIADAAIDLGRLEAAAQEDRADGAFHRRRKRKGRRGEIHRLHACGHGPCADGTQGRRAGP